MFQISCGCTCPTCGKKLILEGDEDLDGQHYCPGCEDYVKVKGCPEQTPEAIAERS